MVAFCGLNLTDQAVTSSMNQQLTETIRFKRSHGFLSIESENFAAAACGLENSAKLAKEAIPKGLVFKGSTLIKYFAEESNNVCRAVLVAEVKIDSQMDKIITTAYNICTAGTTSVQHTKTGDFKEDGGQDHAEQFCMHRLETLIRQVQSIKIDKKRTPTIEYIKGIINIKGKDKKASTACSGCKGSLARLKENHSFVQLTIEPM